MMIVRAALVLAVVLLGGEGCTPREHPRLVWPGDGSAAGAALPDTRANQPYSFGALIVCLDRPGTVTIEDIAVDKPKGGLRITAFAVRRNPMEAGGSSFGNAAKKLDETGFVTSSVDVSTHCPNGKIVKHEFSGEYRSTELAVEFVKPSAATAQGQGLTVTYRSGKDTHTLDIDFSVVLCGPGGKRDHEYCP
jgi:hypothetical protein